jgi:hypothetical protein
MAEDPTLDPATVSAITTAITDTVKDTVPGSNVHVVVVLIPWPRTSDENVDENPHGTYGPDDPRRSLPPT